MQEQYSPQHTQLQIIPNTNSYHSMLIMPGESPIGNYNISQILSEIAILTARNNEGDYPLQLQLQLNNRDTLNIEPTNPELIYDLQRLAMRIAPADDMRNITGIQRMDGNRNTPFATQDRRVTSLFDLLSGALNLLGRIRDVLGHNQTGWAQIRKEIGVEQNQPLEGGSIKSNTKQKTRRNHRKGNYNSRKRYN